MIYRTKIRLKRLANGEDIAKVRQGVVDLIEQHGGKNGTPNPRTAEMFSVEPTAADSFLPPNKAAGASLLRPVPRVQMKVG